MKKILMLILGMIILSSLAFALTFESKIAAESYVADLKSYSKMSVEITDVVADLGSGTEQVSWEVKIYSETQKNVEQCTTDKKTMKESCKTVAVTVTDVLHSETLSSTVSSTASDREVENLVKTHAQNWEKVYQSQQSYKVRPSLIGSKQVLTI